MLEYPQHFHIKMEGPEIINAEEMALWLSNMVENDSENISASATFCWHNRQTFFVVNRRLSESMKGQSTQLGVAAWRQKLPYVVAMGDGTEDTSFENYVNEELGSWQVVTSGKVRADRRGGMMENRMFMKGWADPIVGSVLRPASAECIYIV